MSSFKGAIEYIFNAIAIAFQFFFGFITFSITKFYLLSQKLNNIKFCRFEISKHRFMAAVAIMNYITSIL